MNLLLMRPVFMAVCLMSLVLGAVACSGGGSDGAAPAAPVVPTKQPVAGKMGNITSPATPAPAQVEPAKVAAVAAANALSFHDLDQKPLRSEEVAAAASQIAIFPEVRVVLLKFQRKFAAYPPVGKLGAVLDGRDIGTVIFPEAKYKIFLIV